jgi:hypothetical protein
MHLIRFTLVAGLFALAVGAAPGGQVLKVRIFPINGSSESGMATLTPRGTDVVISIAVAGLQPGVREQFAHLHKGTCEHVAAPTIYVLQPVRNGRSTTRLQDVGLEKLIHGTYSVLIHASSSPNSAHVACGTVSGA